MSKQTIAEYSCSQKDLYIICRAGWTNFKKFDAEFKRAKGFYTKEFADAALSQIDAAEALPDSQRFNEAAEAGRITLEVKAELCKKNFGKLKMYINAAYQDDLQVIMHEQAGLNHYKEAANQNWEALNEMNSSMKNFMTTHLAKLQANTNMPASFESIAYKAIDEFTTIFEKYKKDLLEASSSNSKIRANNYLHRKLSVMFKDAGLVFHMYPELVSLFDFDKILHSVNSSTAKIKGLVTDESDSVVKTAVIKIKYPDEPEIVLIVEEDGSYDTGSIKGGNALITVEAEGFMEVHESLDIPKGAIISKNLRLMRAA
ncbi:MAG: carboxypeptidase-like regulatory domain-containing protein [Bacteroidia bacterium]